MAPTKIGGFRRQKRRVVVHKQSVAFAAKNKQVPWSSTAKLNIRKGSEDRTLYKYVSWITRTSAGKLSQARRLNSAVISG
jgi:hypothetical protein